MAYIRLTAFCFVIFTLAILSCSSRHGGSDALLKAQEMIEDGTIKTTTKGELINLYGPPNTEGYFSEWDNAFWLAREEGYGVDSSWLVVRYDADGFVKEARIVQD